MSSYHLSQLVSWAGKLCFDFPPSLIKWFTSKSAGKLIFKGQRLSVLICLPGLQAHSLQTNWTICHHKECLECLTWPYLAAK